MSGHYSAQEIFYCQSMPLFNGINVWESTPSWYDVRSFRYVFQLLSTSYRYFVLNRKDVIYSYITLMIWRYFVSKKHLRDRITSLRGEVWTYETILTMPVFIEVPVQSPENKRHVFVC